MVDIGLGAVPIMMIGNCGPHHVLVKQKPSRNLLSFIPLFSIITFLLWQTLTYVFASSDETIEVLNTSQMSGDRLITVREG